MRLPQGRRAGRRDRPDAARAAPRPPLAHGEWLEPRGAATSASASPARSAAVFDPNCARVQPAALARGLADAVERLGVDDLRGHRRRRRSPAASRRTDHGDVRAAGSCAPPRATRPSLPGLARAAHPAALDDDRDRAAAAPTVWARSAGTTPRRSPTRRTRTSTSSARPTAGSRSAAAGVRTTTARATTATARSRTGPCAASTEQLHELWPADARRARSRTAGRACSACQRDWMPSVAADPRDRAGLGGRLRRRRRCGRQPRRADPRRPRPRRALRPRRRCRS